MFGRGLARFLPLPARRALGEAWHGIRLRHPLNLAKFRPPKAFSGEHVAVAGLFGTTTGLGRAAELVALTLERDGHRVTRVDLTEALRMPATRSRADVVRPADCMALPISDIVFVINPDHPATLAFERTWLLQRCVIGHWIWEVEVLPWYWPLAVASYDEIWAPTDLVLDVIRDSIPAFDRPLRVVPYAVDRDPMPATARSRRTEVRDRLEIADDAFVAGYSFAVDSNYYRKNPEDAVRVFQRAFPAGDTSVRLFLRCNDFANRPDERRQLEAVIGNDSRVRIFDADDRIGIIDFYAALDVFLSTSRAEGYGLNLVEASQTGLPVIACGWRLAPEISRLPGVRSSGFRIIKVADPQGHYAKLRGATWAAPDLEQMAEILKNDRDAIQRAPRELQ